MNKLQEFWYCVAPQNDIPLYRGEALDGSVVAGLLTFLDYYRNNIQETFRNPSRRLYYITLIS